MKYSISSTNKKTRLVIFGGLLFFLLLYSNPVFAQEIEAVKAEGDTGATIVIFLDTKGEVINAVEGVVTISGALKKEISLTEKGSVISIWLNEPSLVETPNKINISFSGITPGGFSGRVTLFSIIAPNTVDISFQSATTYLNDGLGTQREVTFKKRSSSGAEDISFFAEVRKGISLDKEPPENFKPLVATSSELFGGKLFLSFLTQDKQSGIDYYEVAEKRWFFNKLNWQKAESPYVLLDQEGKSYIYVKAVDKVGNEKIVKLSPLYTFFTRLEITLSIIILLVIVRFLWRRFRLFGK